MPLYLTTMLGLNQQGDRCIPEFNLVARKLETVRPFIDLRLLKMLVGSEVSFHDDIAGIGSPGEIVHVILAKPVADGPILVGGLRLHLARGADLPSVL